MPEISRDEVAHLAMLSRLDLAEGELDEFAGQLDAILAHVKTVSEADTADVPPLSELTGVTNVGRADVIASGLTAAEALSGAPSVEDERFVAPQILGEEQ
ncbi:Asp-tRNA(Asn)/Glu-tRNA(Gln) amidotransferase subunit GatC [Tomitella cavernea]|uniref:Aspartyl/glutamyl-tRNA(Asn/Gln) amidotransferase subunit C n=1 Tax=Tomitella cavernea TaxID=1387982 RepID=A0ABP9CTD1_9ACTN|nr:Asp-tRNA(Asn)/Glu-tRNA(Gln) amidotransferase subunit GatC [Tomitella cavernea]